MTPCKNPCIPEVFPADRSHFRYHLLHDPWYTFFYIDSMNREAARLRLDVHLRVCTEPVDFSRPFGVILAERREKAGFILWLAAALSGLVMEELFRMEMGWALPAPDKLEEALAVLSVCYGFTPREYFLLLKKAEETRRQKPVDLSGRLGVQLTEKTLSLMPPELRRETRACDYVRTPVEVQTEPCPGGPDRPKAVIWKDGRRFPIDKIDSARENAAFETGGVGTVFRCWIKGRQRSICCERPGVWFAETPRIR